MACCLVLFGSAASPFSDGFEANALEPSDIKAISIDAATPIPVQNVKVDAAGLLTAVRVGPPVPPIPVCPEPTHGLAGSIMDWPTMFYGSAPLTSPTWLAPVGAYTLRNNSVATRGPSMVNRYLATTFVAEANQNVTLRLYGAQPIPEAGRSSQFRNGYNPARPASSYLIVVSPCKGDLRPQDRTSPDPWLSKCRVRMSEGAFGWSTVKPAPAASCPLEAGQTYYLSFLFSDGGVSTCKNPADNGRCEVNVRVK